MRQFDDRSVLVTGGSGSFGRRFVDTLLRHSRARRIVVFSRDEYKHYEMQQFLEPLGTERLRFFIGDVRDGDRLELATRDVDFLVHAAALKQVPAPSTTRSNACAPMSRAPRTSCARPCA